MSPGYLTLNLPTHWWTSHQWHTGTRLKWHAIIFLASIAIVILCAIPAAAVSLKSATWAEMCAEAELVVSARIVALQSQASAEPGAHGVCTCMTFEDVRALQGALPKIEPLSVLLGGGTLDGKCVRIPGAPRFTCGEEVVLFLRSSGEASGDYYLLGHGMGVLRVRDGRVIPDLALENGPAAGGEMRAEFLRRFAITDIASATTQRAKLMGETPMPRMVWFCLALDIALGIVLLISAMRRRRRGLALIVLLAASVAPLSLALAGKAAADGPFQYVLEGQTWDLNAPLSGRVENGRVVWVKGRAAKGSPPDQTFGAIESMFQQWGSDPLSALTFIQKGSSVNFGTISDGQNVVSFNPHPPRSIFDGRTLAVTFTTTTDDNLNFLDCDIVFNDRDFTWVDSLDSSDRKSLGSVALHEIGHLLGLAHSTDITNVMYAIAQGYRQLSESDRAGARFLYPKKFHVGTAVAAASPTAGVAPLNVAFFSDQSITSDGGTPVVSWDFGDGSAASLELNPQHVYAAPGNFTATLTLLDPAGNSTTQVTVHVDADGGGLSVKSFSVQDSLVETRSGTDRLSLTLSGMNLAAGDAIHVTIGSLALDEAGGGNSGGHGGSSRGTVPSQPIVLGSNLKFYGAAPVGGKMAARFDSTKKEFSISFFGSKFGRAFDVRTPDDRSQSGSGALPLQVEVVHSDGTSAAFNGTLRFVYQIVVGRNSDGVFERSVRGTRMP